MMGILKKALIGMAATAVVGSLVFGRDVLSYARTWGSTVRDAVKAEVPLDFEVERAREMVEQLVPDIRNCMHAIAEQQVDIEHFSEELASKDANLAEQKDAILALKTDLQSGKDVFVYAKSSRTYSGDEVRRDLTKRFERFKMAQETLDRERQILEAREKTMQANQEKLEKMLSAKQDLEVQIAQLEARLKTVQAAETVSMLEIDDSRLSRAKQLIRELNKQIDVKEKLLDAEGRFTGLIPVETKADAPVDVGKQIDEYFGPQSSEAEVADVD